jgi:single-stranded DNA-specific DHH superfamily exonuclease
MVLMHLGRMKALLGSGAQKKLLLYHTDVDGICSAALFGRFFKGYGTIPMEGPIISEKLLKYLEVSKPGIIVALDLPLDQEWKKLERLLKACPGTRMLIIDHHVPEKDLTSGRIVHVNPRFEKSVYIPASVLVYRMLEGLGKDMGGLIWIAAMGVIGDYAYEDCRDILEECEKTYPEIFRGTPSKVELLSKKLMSAVILHGIAGAVKGMQIMTSAEIYGEAFENGYLNKCHETVEEEIGKVVSEFDERASKWPDIDLYIYNVESRLNIASSVSTRLAEKNPDKMILVVKPAKDIVKVSARYQKGDISLNDLLKETVKGIGSGGGHEKAAGAVVKRSEWREFQNRLIARLTELKKM